MESHADQLIPSDNARFPKYARAAHIACCNEHQSMNRARQVNPYPGAGCPQAGRLAFGAGVDWTDIGYTLATPPNFRPSGSHKENPKRCLGFSPLRG